MRNIVNKSCFLIPEGSKKTQLYSGVNVVAILTLEWSSSRVYHIEFFQGVYSEGQPIAVTPPNNN